MGVWLLFKEGRKEVGGRWSWRDGDGAQVRELEEGCERVVAVAQTVVEGKGEQKKEEGWRSWWGRRRGQSGCAGREGELGKKLLVVVARVSRMLTSKNRYSRDRRHGKT